MKIFQNLIGMLLATVALSAAAVPSTTYYVYDESGHVIGEYDQNGNPVQEHIYLGDRPVAVVQGGNASAISYVTTDQLNTPRAVTDSSQAVEWNWSSDPFGNGQPTGSLTYNLRFPGQYYDAETGHNYNYFRDYDSVTGRYIESDPLGLKGGSFSTYVYTNDNPFKHSDPTGEGFVDCAKALAELQAATFNLDLRIAEKLAHAGEEDPMQHNKAIQQAVNRVENALETVKNSCGCFAGAAAAIAAAGAAIEAAAPYLAEGALLAL